MARKYSLSKGSSWGEIQLSSEHSILPAAWEMSTSFLKKKEKRKKKTDLVGILWSPLDGKKQKTVRRNFKYYLSIYLSIYSYLPCIYHLFIYHLFIHGSINPSFHHSIHPSIIHYPLSIYLSHMYLSIFLSYKCKV